MSSAEGSPLYRVLRKAFVSAARILVLILGLTIAFGSTPPDSKTNPQSGAIETVDVHLSGGVQKIRHTIIPGGGQARTVTQLTDPQSDDDGARLTISSGGDSFVVWYRAGAVKKVLLRKRSYSTGNWCSETLLSAVDESSSLPAITHDGTKAWVAYEFATANGTSIAVTGADGCDPWPSRTALATTSFTGEKDITIDSVSGNLWVTWVDSSTNVGWVEYNYSTSTWSTPSYESYSSDSIAAARQRIRTTVLGN